VGAAARRQVLLLHAASSENATFSYQHGWPRHFERHPRFAVTAVNLAGLGIGGRLAAGIAVRRWRGDAIVLLHSVFSNAQYLDGRLLEAVAARHEPKAFFIGNEYKLMPEKMAFCDTLGVSLLVSQSRSPAVHDRYRRRLGCEVVGIPNTGFDATLFVPTAPADQRPIDLGYRAEASPWYLGHREREDLAEFFQAQAGRLGLTVDISLEAGARFDERGWAGFLNRCKGQLGSEAGGDYSETTDQTRHAVNAFVAANPATSFDEVYERFFRHYRDPLPLRILSGRHVEAAATRTVQVLFEGDYDGYLQRDVHYIPLKKDFSDIDEALRKFRDPALCEQLADSAYRLAMTQFTYDTLIDRFADALASVASPGLVH